MRFAHSPLLPTAGRNGAPDSLSQTVDELKLHIKENGKDVCLMGVHQDSPAFRNSSFYKTIERLIKPHLSAAPEST